MNLSKTNQNSTTSLVNYDRPVDVNFLRARDEQKGSKDEITGHRNMIGLPRRIIRANQRNAKQFFEPKSPLK
jgi:hypothetical protein